MEMIYVFVKKYIYTSILLFLVPEIICLVDSSHWIETAIAAVEAGERKNPCRNNEF